MTDTDKWKALEIWIKGYILFDKIDRQSGNKSMDEMTSHETERNQVIYEKISKVLLLLIMLAMCSFAIVGFGNGETRISGMILGVLVLIRILWG